MIKMRHHLRVRRLEGLQVEKLRLPFRESFCLKLFRAPEGHRDDVSGAARLLCGVVEAHSYMKPALRLRD